MRSYGQYCSLAKALDLVGDRWTLLIIRELLLRGPCRYTDLRDGLPGIATNLLADRLRELEKAGVVTREEAPPPVASTLHRLTPRGEQLRDAVFELARWGIPQMVSGPAPEDEFRSAWLAFPAEVFLADRSPERPPVTIELRAGEQPTLIEADAGEVRTRSGAAEHADVVVHGTPHVVLGLLAGRIGLEDAVDRGLRCEGDSTALERVLPQVVNAAAGGA